MSSGSSTTTTVQDLRKVMAELIPDATYNRSDEVYPGIIVGDAQTAKDIESLRVAGVTHILNSAYEPKTLVMVTTNAEYYKKKGFKCTFCGIAAVDMPSYPLIRHFDEAVEFIEQALKEKGRVYVHCFMGVSRSSTLVIAFLMLKRNMRAIDALRLVRSHRPIVRPNEGFLYQLCELDKRLYG